MPGMEMPSDRPTEQPRVAEGKSLLHEGTSFVLELPPHLDHQLNALAEDIAVELHKTGKKVPNSAENDPLYRLVRAKLAKLASN